MVKNLSLKHLEVEMIHVESGLKGLLKVASTDHVASTLGREGTLLDAMLLDWDAIHLMIMLSGKHDLLTVDRLLILVKETNAVFFHELLN